jgi:hypothetical protein
MRYFFHGMLLIAGFWLGACSGPHEAPYHNTDISGSGATADLLNPGKAVVVSIPIDGVYRQTTYAGSGRDVAQRTAAAFSHYAQRAEIIFDTFEGQEELLRAARRANAGYLVVPRIIHWEPRKTGWALIPAQIDVSLEVINTETGREVRSTVLEGRNDKMSTSPNDIDTMYSTMIDSYAAGLYGAKAATTIH